MTKKFAKELEKWAKEQEEYDSLMVKFRQLSARFHVLTFLILHQDRGDLIKVYDLVCWNMNRIGKKVGVYK